MPHEIHGALNDEAYAEIEHQAYEAAIIPELWPKLLKSITEASGAAGSLVLCANERGQFLIAEPIFERAHQRFVAEGWERRNTRRENAIAKGLVGVGRWVTEEDYFSPGEHERDPLVQELMRPEGFGWAAGLLLDLPHGDHITFNVEQFWDRGPLKGAALDRLNSLYPHLARAAMFTSRAAFEKVRSAIETLTALGLPAAALTPSGRVVLTNDGFNKAVHVMTTRSNDALALHDPVANQQLRDCLDNIKDAHAPRSIAIRTTAGGSLQAVLQIVPIRRAAHDVFGSACAIAVLSETKQAGTSHTLVQSLFDLTPAELSVAQGIAAGKTPEAIALAQGRSLFTVRNQLKSAMAKTGCSRQVELVLLMQQLNGNP